VEKKNSPDFARIAVSTQSEDRNSSRVGESSHIIFLGRFDNDYLNLEVLMRQEENVYSIVI